MPFTYILECADGTLYTGWTVHLENRLTAHNAGMASRYTRGRLPVELVYWEEYPDQRSARKREWEIKRLTRRDKMRLIEKRRNLDLAEI